LHDPVILINPDNFFGLARCSQNVTDCGKKGDLEMGQEGYHLHLFVGSLSANQPFEVSNLGKDLFRMAT